MLIYRDLVVRLTEVLPEFRTEWENGDDVVYPVVEDFIRFLIKLIEQQGQDEVLRRAFGFIEQAIRDGDPLVLEMLTDVFNELALASPDKKIVGMMGPLTRRLLKGVEAEVFR